MDISAAQITIDELKARRERLEQNVMPHANEAKELAAEEMGRTRVDRMAQEARRVRRIDRDGVNDLDSKAVSSWSASWSNAW